MFKFSEKLVRTISLCIAVFLLVAGFKNHWIWVLEILPLMIFVSTKGILMFEDRLWWGARCFWALVGSIVFFWIGDAELLQAEVIDWQHVGMRAVIAICIGSWFGDFFAKYIYVRLRFCLNRLGGRAHHGIYPIVSTADYSKKYLKSPMKKMKISFFYITLLVNGEEREFLATPELFEEVEGKTEMEITVKEGLFGYFYAYHFKKEEQENLTNEAEKV